MNKFGRSYRLTLDLKDGGDPIIITMPLTIQFTIQRNTMASLNNATIDIYNLSEKVRNRIFQDRFRPQIRRVTLEAGYDNLATVFTGNIFEANTKRHGTNLVTTITAFEAKYDIQTSMTFQTFTSGKTVGDVLKFLTGQFQNTEFGAIGDFSEPLNRPVVLNGNTYDLLKKYSANQVFVDLNKVYILKNNEVVEGQVPDLTPETGLIDTPQRDDAFMTVTTLFEPRVGMGQVVNLKSSVMPVYNGSYKVTGVLHQGIISEAVNGPCRSVFNLLLGAELFGEFKTVG